MRKVLVHIWKAGIGGKNEMVEDGKGIAAFHGWGCDYEEFESNAGNYSTAIVERIDGKVENVPVELIKFVRESE